MKLEFWIPGPPVAQARPRFRTFQKPGMSRPIVSTYKPKTSVNYETWVRHHALDAREISGAEMITGPVSLTLHFYLERPKSVSLKKRQTPCVRPDLSNLVKSVEDGMKLAGIWKDDSQICEGWAKKDYADNGQAVGCSVLVEGE